MTSRAVLDEQGRLLRAARARADVTTTTFRARADSTRAARGAQDGASRAARIEITARPVALHAAPAATAREVAARVARAHDSATARAWADAALGASAGALGDAAAGGAGGRAVRTGLAGRVAAALGAVDVTSCVLTFEVAPAETFEVARRVLATAITRARRASEAARRVVRTIEAAGVAHAGCVAGEAAARPAAAALLTHAHRARCARGSGRSCSTRGPGGPSCRRTPVAAATAAACAARATAPCSSAPCSSTPCATSGGRSAGTAAIPLARTATIHGSAALVAAAGIAPALSSATGAAACSAPIRDAAAAASPRPSTGIGASFRARSAGVGRAALSDACPTRSRIVEKLRTTAAAGHGQS
jgi:hypothetical protein